MSRIEGKKLAKIGGFIAFSLILAYFVCLYTYSMNTRIQLLKEMNNDKSASTATLEKKIDNMQSNINSMHGKVDEMTGQVTELQGKLDTTSKELKRLQNAFKEVGVDFR